MWSLRYRLSEQSTGTSRGSDWLYFLRHAWRCSGPDAVLMSSWILGVLTVTCVPNSMTHGVPGGQWVGVHPLDRRIGALSWEISFIALYSEVCDQGQTFYHSAIV